MAAVREWEEAETELFKGCKVSVVQCEEALENCCTTQCLQLTVLYCALRILLRSHVKCPYLNKLLKKESHYSQACDFKPFVTSLLHSLTNAFQSIRGGHIRSTLASASQVAQWLKKKKKISLPMQGPQRMLVQSLGRELQSLWATTTESTYCSY